MAAPGSDGTELQPSLLADVTDDVSDDVATGTMVVAAAADCPHSTYPTVCLYDNRPPTPSSSFRL